MVWEADARDSSMSFADATHLGSAFGFDLLLTVVVCFHVLSNIIDIQSQ